jgi:phosphoglycolate phosphatase
MTFKVILLDFDGTLAATQGAVVACARRVLNEMKRPPQSDEALQRVIAQGKPLETTFAALDPGLSETEIAKATVHYRRAYAEIGLMLAKLFPDVRETLQALRGHGHLLAVLSNKGRSAIEHQLAAADLAPIIDLIFAAEPGMPNKPDPATFDVRVGPAFPGIARTDFLMVGDTATDILFAKNTGIASCWAVYGYGDPTACRALQPDFEIDDFAALMAIAVPMR